MFASVADYRPLAAVYRQLPGRFANPHCIMSFARSGRARNWNISGSVRLAAAHPSTWSPISSIWFMKKSAKCRVTVDPRR